MPLKLNDEHLAPWSKRRDSDFQLQQSLDEMYIDNIDMAIIHSTVQPWEKAFHIHMGTRVLGYDIIDNK